MKFSYISTLVIAIVVTFIGFSLSSTIVSAHWNTSNQHQGVPAYFYPDWWNTPNNWYTMCSTMNTSQGGSTAIMNPNSGPGTAQNSDYVTAVQYCQNHDQNVIGYAHTSYGSRSLSDVESEIDKYYSWYGVDGIFVDEMSNDSSTASYYQTLYNYIHQKGGSLHDLVVGNPGIAALTDWQFADNTVDALVVFEGDSSTYLTWTPPAWVLDTTNYPSDNFWNLVYNASDSTTMQSVMSHSKNVNAGYMYVTPGTYDSNCPNVSNPSVSCNPWGTFPSSSYWSSELQAAF